MRSSQYFPSKFYQRNLSINQNNRITRVQCSYQTMLGYLIHRVEVISWNVTRIPSTVRPHISFTVLKWLRNFGGLRGFFAYNFNKLSARLSLTLLAIIRMSFENFLLPSCAVPDSESSTSMFSSLFVLI